MPVAVKLFNHHDGFENSSIYDSLSGVDTFIDDERAENLIDNELVEDIDPGEHDLRITTEAVRQEDGLVYATIAHDILKPRGHRPDEDSWYRDVERFRVRFCEDLFGDGGFVILGGGIVGSKLLHLHDIMDMRSDAYEREKLTTSVIENIVDNDAQNSQTRTVEDPDEYTEAATASGNVDETGSLGLDLENSGDTTWEMFESLDYDGTVGVGIDSVVFYGNIWTPELQIEYIEDIIVPELRATASPHP